MSTPEAHREPALPAGLFWALLALIFAAGLGVRLYHLSQPMLEFHPTRQLHGALIARGMYYAGEVDVPAWQREMAVTQQNSEGIIEPQIMERISAWGYALAGEADLRIPRMISILSWMGAAVLLTRLALEMVGRAGALAAALFFLAWPYGVTASRAFQPEPLLLLMICAAVWSALRWERLGGWGWTIATGLLAGLALYVKVVAVFFVAPVLAVVMLARLGWRGALKNAQVWVMALLAALPYAIYHINGLYLSGTLAGQFSLRFFPEMWLDPAFYLRWISNLGRAVPFELALLALAAVFTLRRPLHRALLLAWWGGYLAYGFAFAHHISTHDYYHLLLFPLIALGVGAAVEALYGALRGPQGLARGVLAVGLAAALAFNIYEARTNIRRSGAEEAAQALVEIGQMLGPGAAAVALADDYGAGLKYYAWINPTIWPTAADIQFRERAGESFDFEAFFAEQVQDRQYFIITALDELEAQPRLRALLDTRYLVLQAAEGYRIYDLRSPKTGQ